MNFITYFIGRKSNLWKYWLWLEDRRVALAKNFGLYLESRSASNWSQCNFWDFFLIARAKKPCGFPAFPKAVKLHFSELLRFMSCTCELLWPLWPIKSQVPKFVRSSFKSVWLVSFQKSVCIHSLDWWDSSKVRRTTQIRMHCQVEGTSVLNKGHEGSRPFRKSLVYCVFGLLSEFS